MTDEVIKPTGLAVARLQELEAYDMDDLDVEALPYGSAPVIAGQEHPSPYRAEPIKIRGEDGEWVEL